MNQTEPLEKFGKFLVAHLRDEGIGFSEKLLKGEWRGDSLKAVQNELIKLSDEQKEMMKHAFILTIDSAIHDFLFAIQDQNDIQILCDGEDIVPLSDGIHGESFSDEGWNAKYSKYGELE